MRTRTYVITMQKNVQLTISSVNVTKFGGNFGSGHIYSKNP